MIDTVTGWFEITKYDYKCETTTANFVENVWLTRYLWPMQITYNQGSEFIGHDFKNPLIQKEYRINPIQAYWEIQIPMIYWK